MNRHRYLLAYMSGVLLPTWFMLLLLAGFVCNQTFGIVRYPVERMIPFPMALVPNLWGLWNLLYLVLGLKRRMTLGAWGALLAFILVPSAVALQRLFGIVLLTPLQTALALPLVAGFYYLVWKHIVGYLNAVAGVD